MRLGYCCHDSFPSPDTNTQQTFWTILEVARLGAEVELVIPSVNVAEGQDAREAVATYYGAPSDAIPSSLTIRGLGRQKASHRINQGWFDRLILKGWFDWRVPSRLSEGAYDLVWTRDPAALLACARHGLPVIFETYRPDFAAAGRFHLWRLASLKQPSLRGIIAHSQMTADAFIAAGVPEGRCLVARNGFAPSLMPPELDRVEARARLGLPLRDPLIVYTGQVGPQMGIDALVRMAAAVPEARFLVVGVDADSAAGRWLDMIARDAGARNLLTRPRVPVGQLSTYLYAADCLIVPPTDEPLRRFGRTVLPMKIYGYLAAGRPILAPRLPDVEEVLTDGETACLVSPHDLNEATADLVRLLASPALQDRLARNARAKAVEYTWEARAKRLLDFFVQIHASS